MEKDERVLKSPAPAVLAKQFGNNSIDFELQFWTGKIQYWSPLKSDIITEVDKTFKAEGIKIPLPQQDIHIRSIDGMEKVTTSDQAKTGQ